jgi:hypothetical protein
MSRPSLVARPLLTCTLVASLAAIPVGASAICRVVEPASDSGVAPVPFDPRTAALFVYAPDRIVDYRCPIGDDLPRPDYNAWLDVARGSIETPPWAGDAGAPLDPGIPMDEADEGVWCHDGSPAELIRGDLVSLIVQPAVLAGGGEAGLVMPVPARADVRVGPSTLIDSVALLARPNVEETVTVIEDSSLGYQCNDPHYSGGYGGYGGGCGFSGGGGGYDDSTDEYYRPGLERQDPEVTTYDDGSTVRYEELPSTDAYDLTVLNASTPDALSRWLDDHGFARSEDDDRAFAHYVKDDAWFVAVHVHPPAGATAPGRSLALDPLVVTWRGDELPITNQLQYDPHGGLLTTDAFVLAPERRDAADGTAFTEHAAPVELHGVLAGFGLESAWLTRLTLTRHSNEDLPDSAIVPASSQDVLRATITRSTTARIPAPCCGSTQASPSEFRTFTFERSYVDGEGEGTIPEAWLVPGELCAPRAAPEPTPARSSRGCGVRSGRGQPALALCLLALAGLAFFWRRRR